MSRYTKDNIGNHPKFAWLFRNPENDFAATAAITVRYNKTVVTECSEIREDGTCRSGHFNNGFCRYCPDVVRCKGA